MEELTNKEAANILSNLRVRMCPARQNGKSMMTYRINEAFCKAIHLLETTPDEFKELT